MLFIHAGTGKTGTTFLQNFLSANSDELEFQYPAIGRASKSKILHCGHHKLALNYQGANSKNEWKKLINYLRENDPKDNCKWVVSTENLTYATNGFIEWVSNELDDSGINHQYILFVRDTESYALSSFLEYVKVGRVPLYFSIDEFLHDHISSMLVENLVRKFSIASANRLVVLDYNISLAQGTLLDDFLKSIGVRLSSDQQIGTKVNIGRNPSLRPELANCLSSLSSIILEGVKTNDSPTQLLDDYRIKLVKSVTESSSFIDDSPRIKKLILDLLAYAQANSLKNYLLASCASNLTAEFNKAWTASLIKLKNGQEGIVDISRSEYCSQIADSSKATQEILKKFSCKLHHNDDLA
jgi:hypothetical protein